LKKWLNHGSIEVMQTINYEVKTEVFEGPLELLLQLVEKRKLFINDISLAQVSDDYIAHIRSVERFPIGDAAAFVLVASVLILIKSKSLLPKLDLSEEEEQSMDELENRLKEYQRIKELSAHVAEMFGRSIIFPRVHVSKHIKPVFAPEPAISQDSMLESVLSAIKKVPKPEPIEKRTVRKVVSLEEMIESLSERMTRTLRMSFSDFSNQGKVERVTVVVSFLAMLELVKQGTLIVQQDTVFSDILMERNGLG
jgi:segregation and condensation protein A